MIDKNPELSGVVSVLWMLCLAMLGGLVSYLKKIMEGRKWSFVEATIEVVTAAFTGMIMYFLCQWAGMDTMATAALTGISGHFSSRSLSLFERLIDKFENKLPK